MALRPREVEPLPGGPLLKRIGLLVALVVITAVALTSCLTRVDAAHVGIRVKLAGSSRGVDDIPVVTGWVPFNPLTEQIVMFPTSVLNVAWTKDPHEGAPHDESITFSSEEGVNINADIGLSFHIEADKAPHLYLRFRKNDLMDLANGYVRNAVREAFNIEASQMPVERIYGTDKEKVVQGVRKRIAAQLGQDGFVIDQLTINGALRLPENVAAAINKAMEATQQAIQAENRVRQVKAEADQAVTAAQGKAEAARTEAKGQADARLIVARAEAKANLILRASTTPVVLQYRAIERWNGRLPLMSNGQLPLLTFDAGKLAESDKDDKMLRELMGEEEAAVGNAGKDAAQDKDAGNANADAKTQNAAAPPTRAKTH